MNTELIAFALAQGKPVFTLRKAEDTQRFLQSDSENLIACQNEIQLLDKMNSLFYQKIRYAGNHGNPNKWNFSGYLPDKNI